MRDLNQNLKLFLLVTSDEVKKKMDKALGRLNLAEEQ